MWAILGEYTTGVIARLLLWTAARQEFFGRFALQRLKIVLP
jgi:hypothetical protein